jgi:hypothetical protein
VAALEAQIKTVTDYQAAQANVAAATATTTTAAVGTTDADLQAALEAAASPNTTVTPDMVTWAKTELGVITTPTGTATP